MIYPVILSGGSGTRLWPASRKALPKQFLPLVSDRTMFQETLLRLTGMSELAKPLVVCNHEHRFLVAEQLRELDASPLFQIIEPVGRNTAPAVAVAALALLSVDPDGILLVLPADHLIRDVPAFQVAIRAAATLAEDSKLVTFGIEPDAPATGFGYIERGAPLNGDSVFKVARFVEKPDLETANRFLTTGNHYWNSGMFMFRADVYLRELQQHRPDIYQAACSAWDKHSRDLDFCRLDESAFAACPSDSIDYAVMEKTDSAAVITVDIGWNDIGSWTSLYEVSAKDDLKNVARGDVYLQNTEGCYVRADSRLVTTIGVHDLIVVETADAVLVAHKDYAQDIKQAVEHLHREGRDEHIFHRRVFRPWGYYEGIDAGERFQVKRIMVKVGGRLSLQLHHHRAEHWVVVAGRARIIRDDDVIELQANQSTYIPFETKHRLENIGDEPLYLIEVQSGDYLGEDDIVRIEDDYRRHQNGSGVK